MKEHTADHGEREETKQRLGTLAETLQTTIADVRTDADRAAAGARRCRRANERK